MGPVPSRREWQGFAAQVRAAYVAGEIDAYRLDRDLEAAVALDNGVLPELWETPPYLRCRDGFLLVAPGALAALL
jgi:hypothetical protein